MGVQEEQERRRDLLLRALEACTDPEQALAMAVRMEQFIIDGQISREKPHEATQPGRQPSSEEPRKTCIRSRWTAADDAHLRRLWQDDLSVEETAQELQRTPASIYARVRILDLSPSKNDTKKGRRVVDLPTPDKRRPTASSKDVNGNEAVGIDSVVHFLRTRDYSVVRKNDDRYELDGRNVLTAQELFKRANKVRAQLKRPTWAALENGPIVEGVHETNY
ncbi:MAG: hypothetical protein ACTSQ7_05595 [Alphaproteobacteria bacterium]